MTDEAMARLKARFVARCGDDLATLRELRDRDAFRGDGSDRQRLIAIAHGLAGAAGTFGFPDVSREAWELEGVLLGNNSADDAAAALDALIATLEDAVVSG